MGEAAADSGTRKSVRRTPKPDRQCDVLIAGGGPAGAAAAIRLSQAGLRVVVADRQKFPRDKVCGDFVSPIALRQLQALGVTRKRSFPRTNTVVNAALFLDGSHLLTSEIPTSDELPASRVIPRQALDHWLLERAGSAGAVIRQGCRVMSFATTRAGVNVTVREGTRTREIRAKVLVGADGSNSTVARLMRGHPPADDDRIIAVRGYFQNVAGPADRADLYFDSDSFPGYCWLFPVGEATANVGLGVLRNTLPPERDHLRDHLERLIATDEALRQRLVHARAAGPIVGWALTTYNGSEAIVGDRVVLVGDAAGLINPLNGEGIQYALLSGMWAAETVVECVTHDDCSPAALGPYATKIAGELGHDFSLSRALVQLIRNRSLNPLWLEALQTIVARASADPEYARLTGGVLAGVLPARDVLSLDVVRRTLEQAGVRTGGRAVRVPLSANGLAELGVKATQVAIDIATTMLRDPARSEAWASNLATRTRDLIGQGRQYRAEED